MEDLETLPQRLRHLGTKSQPQPAGTSAENDEDRGGGMVLGWMESSSSTTVHTTNVIG